MGLDKPPRRRSSATEELVGETFILDDSARPKAFDDPPLDHLSLNTSGVRPRTPMDSNGFPILEQACSLSVVKVAASSPPSNILLPTIASFDEAEGDDAVKPFSLLASPVRRTDTSLVSLESFDGAAILQSTMDAEKSAAAQDSVKWTTFGEPFGQRDRSADADLFTSIVSDGDDTAFESDVFAGLDQPPAPPAVGDAEGTAIFDANVAAALIQQLGQLTDRLASLEQIVHSMTGANSDQSERAQDVAFIVEGTETLRTSSLLTEEITVGSHNEHATGSKLNPMKRILPARLFGKSVPAKV